MSVSFNDLKNKIITFEPESENNCNQLSDELDEIDEFNDWKQLDKNIKKQINKNIKENEIDLNDYELSEEDKEFNHYFNLLNAFNVYYKNLYNKSSSAHLFDEIDFEDDMSTNRALEMFYAEIYSRKEAESLKKYDIINLFTEDEYSLIKDRMPNDIPLYNILISDSTASSELEKRLTHNLITALLFVIEFNWMECEWSIVQINSSD